jgi:uncharacterized protein (TIGR00725 family)
MFRTAHVGSDRPRTRGQKVNPAAERRTLRRIAPSSPHIAVVGAGRASAEQAGAAEGVGRGLAEAGAVVVCGGLGGVMEAACRGAKAAGGTTVGILPGDDRTQANDYVDVAIATGLGEGRNALIVRAVDALVAVGGEYGTLSEIALALKTGKPVVGIGSWALDPVEKALSAEEAVRRALQLAA